MSPQSIKGMPAQSSRGRTARILVVFVLGLALPALAENGRAPGHVIEHPSAQDCNWVESQIQITAKKWGTDSSNDILVRTNARLCRRDLAVEGLVATLTSKLEKYQHQSLSELFAASHEAWRQQRAAHCAWGRAGNTGAYLWPTIDERACQLRFSELWEARLTAFKACVSNVAPAAAGPKDSDIFEVAGCADHLDLLPANLVDP